MIEAELTERVKAEQIGKRIGLRAKKSLSVPTPTTRSTNSSGRRV